MTSSGTWSLHVNGLGVATVVKTSGDADICLGVAELTSMWTGALSATQLRDYDLLYSRDEKCVFRMQHSSPVKTTQLFENSVAYRALMKAKLMFAMPNAPFTGEFGW